MSDSKYRKEYYKKNKEKIKAASKARYEKIKAEKKAANIGNVNTRSNATFFSIDGPNVMDSVSPINVINYLKSWIYSCSTINASSVASQNLRLYATVENGANNKFLHKTRNISKEHFEYIKEDSSVKSLARIRQADNVVEIIEHPILDLLDNMNSFNNNFESFELTSIYLDMIGDCYWWIRKDNMGIPYEIWVLQGQYMRIVPAKTMNTFIKGYLYGVKRQDIYGKDNGLIKFKRDDIIHFKTPNPSSLYYGKGAAQSVVEAINRMKAMDTSEMARLRNMGRPDFVVNYKGKLDSSEIKKIDRMWNNAFGGPRKAGKIKVMDEDFDLKTLGFSPRDMEYLNGRVWSLKEIASAFGVPYSFLDSSDAKKATSEIAERTYAKTTVLPKITRIAEKLNEQLVPMYDNSQRMFLMYDSPIAQDRKVLLEENIGYVNSGIITVNEARLKMGMAALDGEEYNIPKVNNSNNVDTNVSNSGVNDPSVQSQGE